MSAVPDSAQNLHSHRERIAQEVSNAAALELVPDAPELLVFSSQLIYGTVGLNSAELVYQDHRVSAARVPTILLSVLPHYSSVHHVEITADWITASLQDLDAVEALTNLSFVATGYLAQVGQARAISEAVQTIPILKNRPLIVDPTLGDIEVGFYTDPQLVDGIRHWLLPHASGLVPNLFELSHLAGMPLKELSDEGSIERAARGLMSEHNDWIVVTGLHLQSNDRLSVMLVTAEETHLFSHEYIEHRAKGVGDAYTALLISELIAGNPITQAIPLANTQIVDRLRSLKL